MARVRAEPKDLRDADIELVDTRSPYIWPGFSRFIVTFALPPESGRPSDGSMMAFGTFQFATNSGPERLCQVPLTCTSILGMVYAASP